jgi:ribonucleoside-diphosphate reductase alpha chain
MQQLEQCRVVRRDGRVVPFRPEKIAAAMMKAFLAAQEQHEAPTARARERVPVLAEQVVNSLLRRRPHGGEFHVEEIQDQVELVLMRAGEHPVARRSVLYREERARARAAAAEPRREAAPATLHVTLPDGARVPLDLPRLTRSLAAACAGHPRAQPDELLGDTLAALYDGVPAEEVDQAAVLAARARIESEPEHRFVAARLLLERIAAEVLGVEDATGEAVTAAFPGYVRRGIAAGRLDPALAAFDLERLAGALRPERDGLLAYMGVQTLYDRYLLQVDGRRIELPQWL